MSNPTLKAGEIRTPGVIRTIEGNSIDLNNFDILDVNPRDIAWGTGRTLRFGGHIRQDHTVAHHSIVMSYYVPEEFAFEALMHDAAEAYIGDIIWPVKELFPEIKQLEDRLLHVIMSAFGIPHATSKFADGPEHYVMSAEVEEADRKMGEHEAFGFERPGIYHADIEEVWIKAAKKHEQFWFAPMHAFMQRYRELMEVPNPMDLDFDELNKAWFPDDYKAQMAMREAKEVDPQEIIDNE